MPAWAKAQADRRCRTSRRYRAWLTSLMLGIFRRSIMAKGQQRKNKEVKKPKQDKTVVVVSGSVIPMRPSVLKKK